MDTARIKKNSINILLSSVILLIFVNVSITFYYRNALDDNLLLKNETDQFKAYTNSVLSDIVHGADLSVRGFGLTKKVQLAEPLRKVYQNKDSIFDSMESILTKQGHGLDEFKEMKAATESYISFSQRMLEIAEQDSMGVFLTFLNEDRGYGWWKKFEPFRTSLFQYEDNLNAVAQKKYEDALVYSTITQILLLLVGIPTIVLVILRMIKDLKNRNVLLAEFDDSNRNYVFDSGVANEKIDPVGVIKKATENLRSAAEFVSHLSMGNYEAQWTGFTKSNESLNKNNLSGRLVQLRESLNSTKREDEKRIWANEGLTRFSELVRNNQHNRELLSFEIVKYLAKYLRAQQAGLFVIQEEIEPYLKLSACYAFDRKKYVDKIIKVGEGLIGQAYLEGQSVFLKEIPKNYVQITSGLGDASPNCIAIVPFKYNGKIEAIIELASFYVFEKHQVEFLEKAGEFVASALLNTNESEKMQRLLSQSQMQSESMRTAEEELRQNIEEMEATQEEMRRLEQTQKKEIIRLSQQHEESIARFKRLSLVADNTDNSVVITDAMGFIEYVNNGFTKLTGYNLEEVIGKKPGTFLQGRGTDQATVKRIKDKLNLREPFYEEILNYDKKGKDYWISLAINPIIEDGQLTKFISIQSNVTLTKLQAQEFSAQVEAVGRFNSIVSFDLQGIIQNANQNFLDLMGYSFEEIKNKHHRMFLFNEEGNTPAYAKLWEDLNEGKFVSGEFKRKTKQGNEIWLNGTYAAIMDLQGNPYKVMKFAQDITSQKVLDVKTKQLNNELKLKDKETQKKSLELNGVISAINSTLANIEFSMEGNIITANENFLSEMGYTLKEIQGKHHSLFIEHEYARSKEYADFWINLNQGNAQTGEVERVTKSGERIWFSASYTPVMDENNKPFKVIKFAQNITRQKQLSLDFESQMSAIDKSYAVIEFDMQGHILKANENFLGLMEYGIDEIRGKHHKIFVDHVQAQSSEYKMFWKKLNSGEFITSEFTRFSKSGREVKIKGSYSPIKDISGKPYKIVKYALEIRQLELSGK